jgi:hypothetical protein
MRAKRVSLPVFMEILNQAKEIAKKKGNESLAEIYGKATEEIKKEINSISENKGKEERE